MTSTVPAPSPAGIPAEILASGVTVFFPAYNDAPTIADLVRGACRVLSPLACDYEVVVINDGSRDGTASVLDALEAEIGPRLRVVTHPFNRGYGAALRSGFAAARYPWVFYTDGDGQYDVSELRDVLELAGDGVGLVNGYKLRRHDPVHRIWIGHVYNQAVRRLFGIRLRDIDCDFRLIRRRIVSPQRLTADGGTICIQIAMLAESSGLSTIEAPVHHYPRLHGHSQFFRIAPLWNTLRELTSLYFGRVVRPRFRRLGLRPVNLAGSSRAAEGD